MPTPVTSMQSAPLVLLLLVAAATRSSALTDVITSSSSTFDATISNTTASTLCDSQLLFQKLYVLTPAIEQCAKESDYFVQPANLSYPSEVSLQKFCDSKNCSQLSVELDNAGLPSCTVPVGNTTTPFKVFFKDIKTYCDNLATGTVPSAASSGAFESKQWRHVGIVVMIVFVTLSVVVQ